MKVPRRDLLLRLSGHANAYYDTLEDRAQAAADAALEAAELAAEAEERRLDAQREYAGIVGDLNDQLFDLSGASEFAQAWANARIQQQRSIAALNDAAGAAGLSTARQEDMNLAMEVYRKQIERATAALRQNAPEFCCFEIENDAYTALLGAHAGELDLYAVHAVDAVNKQDQDEDECYLVAC